LWCVVDASPLMLGNDPVWITKKGIFGQGGSGFSHRFTWCGGKDAERGAKVFPAYSDNFTLQRKLVKQPNSSGYSKACSAATTSVYGSDSP